MNRPFAEHRRDIAHVKPVEMFTPKLEATRDFFVNQMALREIRCDHNSVYLHASAQAYRRLHNAGARLMLALDWEPVTWSPEERAKGQAWGLKTIETFHTYGTPVIDLPKT